MTDQALVQHGDIVFASLLASDRSAARRFYADVLGWRYEVIDNEWQDVEVMGANVQHALDQVAGAPTLFACYAVDDVRKSVRRVEELGGTVGGDPIEEDGGLTCGCTDPLGSRFTLYEFLGARTPRATRDRAAAGDLVEVVVETPSVDRLASFYADLLGWDVPTGGGPVPDTAPPCRVVAADGGRIVPVYGVEDLAAALGRVASAGGRAQKPADGFHRCTDDQGTEFGLAAL